MSLLPFSLNCLQGHAGAAIAYGSLLLRGQHWMPCYSNLAVERRNIALNKEILCIESKFVLSSLYFKIETRFRTYVLWWLYDKRHRSDHLIDMQTAAWVIGILHLRHFLSGGSLKIMIYWNKQIWSCVSYLLWCFLNCESGAPVPEAISKFTKKRKLPTKLAGKNVDSPPEDPIVKAKEQFQIAADAGCDLGLHWLKRLADFEKQQITQWNIEVPRVFSLFSYAFVQIIWTVIDTSRLLYGPQTGAQGIWSGGMTLRDRS